MVLCTKTYTFAHKFQDCAMESIQSFNSYIEKSIKENWDKDALTDYKGSTLQYHDVARKIEKLHILFQQSGIQQGDKIALCGRNSAAWAAAFLAVITYGAVAVPIQHEFTSEQVYNIVNHSEARLLFVGDVVATTIDDQQMTDLEGIIYLPDFSLVSSRSEKLSYARENLNRLFGEKYPKYFHAEHISYHHDSPEELALINYTSGTTGFSKGVMLPYRSLWSNLQWANETIGVHLKKGSNALSILPMAHMYGLMCELLFEFCFGNHIYFLTRLPSPSFIAEACTEVKPAVLMTVPMVIEKIIRKKIFPIIQDRRVHLLLNMPVVNKKIRERICNKILELFGGNLYEVLVGGAVLNKEIEQFLLSIGFPLTIIYGTTETGPAITNCDYKEFVGGTSGRVVQNMELSVLSDNPSEIPGEIITRGKNVMLGYYKNEEATQAVIDENGWFHTGDLGTIDRNGNLYIRGRIKNMFLSANGQNIYPEEIEGKLNSMTMVNESIIIQKNDKLYGLVYPDMDEARQLGFTNEDVMQIMEQNRKRINESLPTFSKIVAIKIHPTEFQKTPKKSIKRYLYYDVV